MSTNNNLTRFLDAQNESYPYALKEIKKGKKTRHWMWFIFPQISGLGFSETSKYYAIKNKDEATEFLDHEVLGKRLIEISNELLNLNTNDPVAIFGMVDSVKLKCSMTLFSLVEKTNPVFLKVLDKFFGGERDQKTIQLLNIAI